MATLFLNIKRIFYVLCVYRRNDFSLSCERGCLVCMYDFGGFFLFLARAGVGRNFLQGKNISKG